MPEGFSSTQTNLLNNIRNTLSSIIGPNWISGDLPNPYSKNSEEKRRAYEALASSGMQAFSGIVPFNKIGTTAAHFDISEAMNKLLELKGYGGSDITGNIARAKIMNDIFMGRNWTKIHDITDSNLLELGKIYKNISNLTNIEPRITVGNQSFSVESLFPPSSSEPPKWYGPMKEKTNILPFKPKE